MANAKNNPACPAAVLRGLYPDVAKVFPPCAPRELPELLALCQCAPDPSPPRLVAVRTLLELGYDLTRPDGIDVAQRLERFAVCTTDTGAHVAIALAEVGPGDPCWGAMPPDDFARAWRFAYRGRP